MAGLIAQDRVASTHAPSGRRALARDGLIVAVGGQVERILGLFTAFAIRRFLDPSGAGLYAGLRLYLDNTNRSSLGIGLGAVQEIPSLRAAGRESEAERVANVAHTANSVTCLVYAAGLVLWALLRRAVFPADPLADEWTWGLCGVALLSLLQRYLSWLVALHRAHGRFALTTEVDVAEAIGSPALLAGGAAIGGLRGLLVGVGCLLIGKIAYLRVRHPLRPGWAWDWVIARRLFFGGLPILANTAVFGVVLNIDRIIVLRQLPEGERQTGLYGVALLGTSWALDVAGRIVAVLYTDYRATLGRTEDAAAVARRAMRAADVQIVPLALLSAAAYASAPEVLALLLPRYREGLPALRPLMPGMLLLAAAWPTRQSLIALDRSRRLLAATALGALATYFAGSLGARSGGLVGVAWGVSIGYAVVFGLTTWAALSEHMPTGELIRHCGRSLAVVGLALGAAELGVRLTPGASGLLAAFVRLGLTAILLIPLAGYAARRDGWLALLGTDRRRRGDVLA